MSLRHIEQIPDDIPGFWSTLAARLKEKGVSEPNVTIHGGYGKRNMGDDALLFAIHARVRNNLPGARIAAICHGPENIRPWFPDIAAYRFKSSGAMLHVLRSDVYIIGGGGIINKINTYSGNMVFRLLDMKGKYQFLAAFTAQLCGAHAVFYAIGAESFPDAGVRLLARGVLNRVQTVSVRDPLSRRNLISAGVRREIIQVLDPALSLTPEAPESVLPLLSRLGFMLKGKRKRPLIGMNIRYVGDPAVSNERSLDETARLIRHLVENKNVDVLFLPISQHPSKNLEDDLDFGRQVAQRLRACGAEKGFRLLEEYPHPRVYMALLGQMDAMVLSRLHSVIFGTKLGIPILTVSYDDKVTEFVHMTGQARMLISLDRFTLENTTERIDQLLNAIDPLRSTL